jgi:LacI family xylobiose transport system transcriptional regulator
MPSDRGKADLARIADEAGVSVATVSRVLNGRTGVSDRNRLKVESVIREQGYVRRTRAVESAPLIELVVPYFHNAWAVELVRGIQRIARPNGMSVIISKTGDHHGPERSWIDGVVQRGVGAIVLVLEGLRDEEKRRLRSRNVPFALVNPGRTPGDDVPTVTSSAFLGGRQAARHLVRLGHRRIGAITGPGDMLTSQNRIAGFREELETAGISVDRALIRPGRFDRASGFAQGRKLLTSPDRPTAIFAGGDSQALGVYEAARTLGLRIPDDVSVVGFDDLEFTTLIGPALTTVRQPLADMTEEAARLALSMGEQRPWSRSQPAVELETTLIVRSSTAPPPVPFGSERPR